MKKVLDILAIKYGCTRVEKIEDFMDDWTKFKDYQYVIIMENFSWELKR